MRAREGTSIPLIRPPFFLVPAPFPVACNIRGGVAGLALAARLSEWSNTTVAVLEAGGDGSAFTDRVRTFPGRLFRHGCLFFDNCSTSPPPPFRSQFPPLYLQIDIPGNSYLDGLTGTAYDWAYTTTAQRDANGTVKAWPRGKGLGGSGAINGLFWVRPSDQEFNAWKTLNEGGETVWDGAVMREYMNKVRFGPSAPHRPSSAPLVSWLLNRTRASRLIYLLPSQAETFHAPTEDQQSTFSIAVDPSAHGTSGPIQAGFSAYIYSACAHWVPTLVALGWSNADQHAGNNHAVNLTPSSLNPANQTRSDSKAGYIDPLPPRDNLVILTGYQVTEVVWNSTASANAVAGGLTFAAEKGAESYTVYAAKEVILAGGTVNTPQMLQLSGVGPADLLTGLGIDGERPALLPPVSVREKES